MKRVLFSALLFVVVFVANAGNYQLPMVFEPQTTKWGRTWNLKVQEILPSIYLTQYPSEKKHTQGYAYYVARGEDVGDSTMDDPGPIYHRKTYVDCEGSSYPHPSAYKEVVDIDTLYHTSSTNRTWMYYYDIYFGIQTERANGNLSITTTNLDANLTHTLSLSESSRTSLFYDSGTSGWTFWYKIYFSVQEGILTTNSQFDASATVSSYVPASKISIAGQGAQESGIPGVCYVIIPILGGAGPGVSVDITPSASVPFFFYNYGTITFDHAVQNNPVPQTN